VQFLVIYNYVCLLEWQVMTDWAYQQASD